MGVVCVVPVAVSDVIPVVVMRTPGSGGRAAVHNFDVLVGGLDWPGRPGEAAAGPAGRMLSSERRRREALLTGNGSVPTLTKRKEKLLACLAQ